MRKKIGKGEFVAIKNKIEEVLGEVLKKDDLNDDEKRKLEWDELTKIFFNTGMEKIYTFCIIEYEEYLKKEEASAELKKSAELEAQTIYDLYIELKEKFTVLQKLAHFLRVFLYFAPLVYFSFFGQVSVIL